jgi:nitrate/TMAO reductase-like tetraheme cytochrome c subunit
MPARCADWKVTNRSLDSMISLSADFSASLLGGEEAPTVYQPPKDIAEEWAMAIALVLIVCAAALVLYVLVFRRRRLAEPISKWLLAGGICVLPLPVVFLGTAVGLEHSKVTSFCASCHPMEVFVEDMLDPASDTLAALHFKNRYIQREHCYRCHTDYGIFGTVEAKMAGLGHIWKDATDSYELPIEISKPYSPRICLDCHAQSLKFQAQSAHEGIVAAVLQGEISCSECHGLSHPPRDERSGE